MFGIIVQTLGQMLESLLEMMVENKSLAFITVNLNEKSDYFSKVKKKDFQEARNEWMAALNVQ